MDRREVEANLRPMIRHPTDPRVCVECQKHEDKEIVFFDPKCHGCQELLESPNTSISELFAILRQWSQPVQQSLELIIRQILQAGTHVDDRDGLTDMTMLHYAVKAGTRGMGDAEESCRMVRLLLSHGADPYIRCRWTNMAAIHYAIYFDVAPVVTVLLDATKAVDVDSPCSEFDHGTPLHIAARCLALNSARELLEFGADPTVRDITGRLAIDWLPDGGCFDPDSETGKILSNFRQLLQDARPPAGSTSLFSLSNRETDNIVRILNTFGINVGDKVLVGGVKTGILRYCGPTLFANGFWAGIELDEAVGKNNGSIDGIQYFKCPPNYGIFAPLTKISKPGHLRNQSQSSPLHHSRVKLDHVTAKVNTGLKQSKSDTTHSTDVVDIGVGDRVLVANKRTGVVMYRGETEFAPGLWFGIELDKPVGKNDGSINGKQYFSCQQNYGVFAPSSRIQKLTDSVVVNNSFKLSSQKAASSVNIHRRPSTESSLNLHTPHTPDKNHLNRSKVFNSVSTKGSPLSPLTNSSSGELKLVEGMNVFCNGEIGVLCYMGAVDFADGIWLGVELRTAKGKHDGSVQGRRYFTCRPGHGLLVRPNRVSVRGINGARLISAD